MRKNDDMVLSTTLGILVVAGGAAAFYIFYELVTNTLQTLVILGCLVGLLGGVFLVGKGALMLIDGWTLSVEQIHDLVDCPCCGAQVEREKAEQYQQQFTRKCTCLA